MLNLIIVIIFLIALYILFKIEKYEVVFVVSTLDQNSYLVRDLPDKQEASNLLAQIKQNITKTVDHLYKNKEQFKENIDYIQQLKDKIENVVINESSDDSAYTSYSVNKGEQIVFCLRSKIDSKLHDINLLMYVALHEISHVANPKYGHGELFKQIFSFICDQATKLNVYSKMDFHSNPVEYCGIKISESII